jgi:hypothetical protein
VDKDRYEPATKKWAGKYSPQLLETIDWCLDLDHHERPLSVFALQKALTERQPAVNESTWIDTLGQRLRGLIK